MSDQVIRNFELMGRVNLDQLELIKDQESSCEEEDERDVMEMAENENVARPEDAEEDEEGQEEERDVMESMQEERGMDDEEMEGFGEEAEEQEEEVNEEVAEERHPLQGRPIGNLIIYSIFLLSSTSWNWQFIQTLFPRSPWVSHQHLRSERRGAAPLRVLRPLLHQQPGVGTSRPAPRHVSVFAHRTRRSGLFSGLSTNKRSLQLGLCLWKDSRRVQPLCIHVCTHAHCRSSPSSAGR